MLQWQAKSIPLVSMFEHFYYLSISFNHHNTYGIPKQRPIQVDFSALGIYAEVTPAGK